jgi:ABC-type transport system involved in Fe-S cluster assembly fused permease/ATPase subunit
MLLNQMLPITLEVVLSNLALWYFCGPLFFFNSVLSLYVYGRVTKTVANDRKSALQKNYKVERDAFGLLHESVLNAFTLKAFQAGKLERVKYIKSTL